MKKKKNNDIQQECVGGRLNYEIVLSIMEYVKVFELVLVGHCSSSWQAMVWYGNGKPVFGQWMVVVVVLGSRLASYLLIRRPTKSYQWLVTHSLDSGLLNELRKFQTTICNIRKRGLCFSTTDRAVTGNPSS